MSKGQDALNDVISLVKARHPILWIISREEGRVERLLSEGLATIKYATYTWDVAQGVCEMDGKPNRAGGAESNGMLTFIGARATGQDRSTGIQPRAAWIMRDMHKWLDGVVGLIPQRRLRNLARLLPNVDADKHQVIIILTPIAEVPAELMGSVTVIDWPLPDRSEIAAIYDAQVDQFRQDPSKTELVASCDAANREDSIDASLGLSSEEATNCFAKSLVTVKRFDPAVISKEKKRVIARERVLEWMDPLPGGMADVGGLDNLKGWLGERANAYSPEARAYGLPTPRGIFVTGMSGCGKSMTAKATATLYGCPLLRMDLGALKSKYVGESEQNLRKAFNVIDTIGKCVILLDEIEKAISGADNAADGGVSQDALGAILTWMQERKNEAFIIATCNDPRRLPPELLRKERFDEVFFVDLPNAEERAGILESALRRHARTEKLDLSYIASVCENYTGAEVANLIPTAMFKAFRSGARPITTDDVIEGTGRAILMTTMKEKMEDLRLWARGRAIPATTPDSEQFDNRRGRQLDVA